jgi:hypothetical protein
LALSKTFVTYTCANATEKAQSIYQLLGCNASNGELTQ